MTVQIGDLRVTPFICYDLRFADVFWRAAPDTDVYLVPANWPSARRLHWQTLLQARAIENQAYVVGCNRVGTAGDGPVTVQVGDLRVTPFICYDLRFANVFWQTGSDTDVFLVPATQTPCSAACSARKRDDGPPSGSPMPGVMEKPVENV